VAFWLRFGLQGAKVGNDAIDMEDNEGLSAFGAVVKGGKKMDVRLFVMV